MERGEDSSCTPQLRPLSLYASVRSIPSPARHSPTPSTSLHMPTRKEKYDRRSWTSVEQWHWLYEHYPAYRAAQRVNTRHTFLGGLYHDWFVEWPEIRILHDHGKVKLLSDEEKKLLGKAIIQRKKVRIDQLIRDVRTP